MLNYIKNFSIAILALIFIGCDESSAPKDALSNTSDAISSQSVINLEDYASSNLSDTQKYSLAYMWNEEKLAYDIYTELNKLYPLKVFTNIANKSEIVHIELVENLIQKYDINITNLHDYTIEYSEAELRSFDSGIFGVPEIQNLYNALYDLGDDSLKGALKVGCMVEVTDIDDLDKYITDAGGAEDLVDTFKVLREGSYKHYWGFDQALKGENINNGCCSLGIINGINYCKTEDEYPRK